MIEAARRPRHPALAPAALFCAALLLAGCAATPPAKPAAPPPPPQAQPQPPSQAQIDAKRQAEFDKSLDSWHGAKMRELTGKLGQPSSTERQPNGTLVYVYAKSTKLSGPNGQKGTTSFSCVVRYLIDERADRVTGHRIEGC